MKPSRNVIKLPSRKVIKLRRSKRSTNLLKNVLQKSVYEKLPIGRRFRHSLTNIKGDKMSDHFMVLANSIAVRLDSYCKRYASVHGKSHNRLVDAIERINEMLAEEGFERSAQDDFDSWNKDDVSRSDQGRTSYETSNEIETQNVPSSIDQRTHSPTVTDKSELSEGCKVVTEIEELKASTLKLKAIISSFIDHTWRYKARKEIVIKEMIMNLLESGDFDDGLAVSPLASHSHTNGETSSSETGFEDETDSTE